MTTTNRAIKLFVFVALALALGQAGCLAHAQNEKPTPAAPPAAAKASKGGKKQTSIDFEDELIEGEMKKPELFYLLQKKQFNFKRLIKLREDFLPEMRRDADEIRRGRSKN